MMSQNVCARCLQRIGKRTVSMERMLRTSGKSSAASSSYSSHLDHHCINKQISQFSTTTRALQSQPSTSASSDHDYVSPFKDFFDMIQDNKISSGKDADDYSTLSVKKLRCGVSESALKFKTVAYGRLALPPYVLPQEHKVTMKVSLDDIIFEDDLEKEIFYQIVGQRYNSEKNELTLISSQFASRIENKRHAVSMLERIMESSKFLAKDVRQSNEQS